MKANETTEKIYLTSDEKNSYVFTRKRSDNEGVEYTRTDALIEKACDAYCKVCGHYAHTTPNHICRQACDYYRDFREHIKRD